MNEIEEQIQDNSIYYYDELNYEALKLMHYFYRYIDFLKILFVLHIDTNHSILDYHLLKIYKQ